MITVVTRPRRGGKSTEAIAWLAESPHSRIIICPSAERAANLLRMARIQHPGTEIPRGAIVDYQSASDSLRGAQREVCVEDMDSLIAAILPGHRVGMVTITGEAG